jgi:hypothetical protein
MGWAIENPLMGIGIPDRPIKLLGINRQCHARHRIPRHTKDSFKAGNIIELEIPGSASIAPLNREAHFSNCSLPSGVPMTPY